MSTSQWVSDAERIAKEAAAKARETALEEAIQSILKRCCSEMQRDGFCAHQPCDYYQNAMSEIAALKARKS